MGMILKDILIKVTLAVITGVFIGDLIFYKSFKFSIAAVLASIIFSVAGIYIWFSLIDYMKEKIPELNIGMITALVSFCVLVIVMSLIGYHSVFFVRKKIFKKLKT